MSQVKVKLQKTENKCKLFKQQQFTFIAALDRSREIARDTRQPVASISQVQNYMDKFCSNTTDQRIFALFFDIVEEMRGLLQTFQSLGRIDCSSEVIGEACNALLNPNYNISSLRAHYPHDEVNRLSCDEARNYYGGVVSLFPLALDYLQQAAVASINRSYSENRNKTNHTQTYDDLGGTVDSKKGATSGYPSNENIGGRHAGKPAWRPPGCNSY